MTAAFANASLRIELDGAALDAGLARAATGVVVRQRLSAPTAAVPNTTATTTTRPPS